MHRKSQLRGCRVPFECRKAAARLELRLCLFHPFGPRSQRKLPAERNIEATFRIALSWEIESGTGAEDKRDLTAASHALHSLSSIFSSFIREFTSIKSHRYRSQSVGKEEPESSVEGGMRVKRSTHGLKSDGSLTLSMIVEFIFSGRKLGP